MSEHANTEFQYIFNADHDAQLLFLGELVGGAR